MKTIPLHNGEVALVDDEDYELVSSYTWRVHGRDGYAQTNVPSTVRGKKQDTLFMHRIIAKPPKGMEVDHINGNKLDNRRANLRVCTHAENVRNRPVTGKNRSGHKGVYFNHGKWRAMIGYGGKAIHLGNFNTIEEAARAYDAAAEHYHGEFAKTNAA